MAKILLVEPDKQLANTIKRALEHFGHSINTCGTAQSAIHATDTDQPEIIVLELQLPIHNGIEFLYELRSYLDWQKLPIIIHSQVPPTIKAISPMLWDQLRITAYLYKPHTRLADLADTIGNTLVAA